MMDLKADSRLVGARLMLFANAHDRRRLHRHSIGILPVHHGAALFRRCQLRDHRPLHRRSLAQPAPRQRHGLQLWHRQSREDHWTARIGADRRFVRLRQSQGRAFGAVPGLIVPRLLVRAGGVDVLVGRLRAKGRSIEEINRTLDTPAGVALDPVCLLAQ